MVLNAINIAGLQFYTFQSQHFIINNISLLQYYLCHYRRRKWHHNPLLSEE